LEVDSLATQLRAKHAEMMVLELETVALRLFQEWGFTEVTVDEIASAAHVSVRTFYRYFPTKEDVLQVRIDRRSEVLSIALASRPLDEPPLQALRRAAEEEIVAGDTELLHRWITVVAATPSVLRSVVGGIQLKTHQVIADFFGSRLGQPAQDLVPTMLAAAAGGVIQAAHTQWFLHGGDLAATVSESLEVLDRGIASVQASWPEQGRNGKTKPGRSRNGPTKASPRAAH
jgi:TetR/AcrR family transcriptional regulator, regulator of mycofactocin system